MHTFGDDFQYSNATRNFENIDKLINYINNNDYGMTLQYSTPSIYLN